MQDGAAEINLNEDFVRSRRWRQIKLIVLQEEQAPDGGGPPPVAPPRRSMDNYSSQPGLTPLLSNLQQHLNLELFTFKRT